jgi:hypothetical protein
MTSPYSRRSAIRQQEEFFGRRAELRALYGLISRKASVYLVGERRVGKSSLLNALRFERSRSDAGVQENVSFVFLNSYYFADASQAEFLRYLFLQISQEIEAPIFDPEQSSFLEAGEFAQYSGRQLVVLIDEFDILLTNRNLPASLYGSLRAWAEQFEIPFVIVCREGNVEPLLKMRSIGSPFWNIYQSIYVGPLQPAEARELVTVPALRLERDLSEDQVRQVLSWGGLHPFFLQMAADHTFQHKTPADQKFNFLLEAEKHFRYLLSVLSEAELGYLTGLIKDAKVKSELLRKGILISEGSEERVFSTIFEEMLPKPESVRGTVFSRIAGSYLK